MGIDFYSKTLPRSPLRVPRSLPSPLRVDRDCRGLANYTLELDPLRSLDRCQFTWIQDCLFLTYNIKIAKSGYFSIARSIFSRTAKALKERNKKKRQTVQTLKAKIPQEVKFADTNTAPPKKVNPVKQA